MAGALEGDVFIGRKAQEFRGLLKIKYPMEHGIVTDWDDMERIWNWVYTEELGTLSEEHPVLLTEAPLNPRNIFGPNNGIVLDSGDGVTHAVPVFEGFSMPHAIRRIDIAGRDVTDHLQLLLRKSGHHLHTTAEREVVRTIKEKCCYVALNPAKEEKDTQSRSEDLKLPDGKVIQPLNLRLHQLGSERFRAPEILFNPELIGQEYAGVHQVVVDSINRVDLDLRKSLFSNIVLSGGSTLCRNFGDRLLNEVKKLALKDVKIRIYAPPERKYSTWIGGSILAGLNTFKKVSKLNGARTSGRTFLARFLRSFRSLRDAFSTFGAAQTTVIVSKVSRFMPEPVGYALGPTDTGVRTSFAMLHRRRSRQSQYCALHQSACGNQRSLRGSSQSCTLMRASRRAPLSRRWGGKDGGHRGRIDGGKQPVGDEFTVHLNQTPPPDDPSHGPLSASSRPSARAWFPNTEDTSYQSGGIPSFNTSMTGGGPQVDEGANVNQWETTYGLRVDVLAAVAYLLGPFSGAFNTIHFRESLTTACPALVILILESQNDYVRFHGGL
ncbi:actin [Salix suchowensis]|nr:actin [Salix suchowensis]